MKTIRTDNSEKKKAKGNLYRIFFSVKGSNMKTEVYRQMKLIKLKSKANEQ